MTAAGAAKPGRPTRLSIAAFLIGIEGILLCAVILAYVLGGARDVEMHIADEVYVLGPPAWPWFLGPLAPLTVIAAFLAGAQRYFWLVALTAAAMTFVGLSEGLQTGQWAWLVTRGIVLALVVSSRHAFVD